MASNRSKIRRFGPNAPSFRGKVGGPNDPLNISMESPSGLRSPSLPSHVQASLLQVGMRVRKSIFDGYKTNPKTFEASLDYCLQNNTLRLGFSRRVSSHFPIYQDEDVAMGDDGFPSSSQETVSSTTSSMPPPASPPRMKRALDDFEDEDLSNEPEVMKEKVEEEVESMNNMGMRKIAKIRAKKKRAYPTTMMEDVDFGEADFLVYE